MSWKARPRVGEGVAWLVLDRAHDDYLCSWYAGNSGEHLVERAHAPSAAAAVAWGRSRTSRVRIRMGDARTCWAGRAPAPATFAGTWSEDSAPSP